MENSKLTASIVVPSYRGASRLPALLDALSEQTVDLGSFETIVVVDGVDDGSVELLATYPQLRLRHILFPENRGRVAALNAGFDAANGDVLIRCDDDLLPAPDYVEKHTAAHEGRRHGVVGLVENLYTDTRYAAVYGRNVDRRARQDAYASSPDRAWRFWGGNCSMTRDIWDEIGRYDPEYRLYGWEDIDYGFRIHRAGIPVVLHPELETRHRIAAVDTSLRAQRAAHSAAARRTFETKHGDEHLPSAVPALSAWNALVRVGSRVVGDSPKEWGARVDQVLDRVPAGVATKLVALTVEASALAGYRVPSRAGEVF